MASLKESHDVNKNKKIIDFFIFILDKQGKLDAAAKILIDKSQISVRIPGTRVLNCLSIDRLKLECGKSLDTLRLHDLRVLLGRNHADFARLVADSYRARPHKFFKLGLCIFTVRAPVSIVHGEDVLARAPLEHFSYGAVVVEHEGA